MPEIKTKHVVSFSSEDKVHKAENLLKSETYRKWKCATPGEKNASIILQFEKATKIHSIDIGNESSAFVEVLVGRSSDSVNNYQVLLVASSFMSPIESRNESHTNRVRMFGAEKLAQNLKEEKWDCVQVVCTQPFNKNITYGLSFIKFHSPPEKIAEQAVESSPKTATTKLGAFKVKYDDEEDEDLPSIGSWLDRKRKVVNSSLVKTKNEDSPSYASTVLASRDSNASPQNTTKRKYEESNNDDSQPYSKKQSPVVRVNKEKIGYKDIIGKHKAEEASTSQSKDETITPKNLFGLNISNRQSPGTSNKTSVKPAGQAKTPTTVKAKPKVPFRQLMNGVVFVISGFVNPLRSEIRDKALEMGAKYKGDWDRTCTHLICAFVNTPKYVQVRNANGKIVAKDWIMECHNKRTLLPWRKYMLGRYSRNSSESEEEEEVSVIPQTKKDVFVNGSSKNIQASKADTGNNNNKADLSKNKADVASKKLKSDSETEDEEALQDYLADTDVGSDSGGDTEEEIRKVENKAKQKTMQKNQKKKDDTEDEALESDEDSSSLLQSKPDTSALSLPELPNLFKSKHFYLYGEFSPLMRHNLKRYIIAYNGILKEYMSDTVKYVISEAKWDDNFEDALAENEDLIFVKPEWILKCHEKEKLAPYQPYIIIPDT